MLDEQHSAGYRFSMLKYSRLSLVILLVGFSSIVGIFFCLLRPFHPNNATNYGRWMGKICCKILGIKVILENHHFWYLHTPALVISNHQDNLDIFICGSILHQRTVSLGKKQIIFFPLFGLFYWLSGNIIIDRSNKEKAWRSMEKVKKAIKEDNISIWMMPEGTRSRGKGLLAFKKGAFITAISAQTKILPIVVSEYVNEIDLNKWQAGTVHIKILPPIETDGLTASDAEALTQKAQLIFQSELKS